MTTNGNGRTARVQQLGQRFQHLAERTRALADTEPSTVWGYFLLGMSFAHEWDAGRVREAFEPSVDPQKLPDLAQVSRAYESIITMITEVGGAGAPSPDGKRIIVCPDPTTKGSFVEMEVPGNEDDDDDILDIDELMAMEPELLGS